VPEEILYQILLFVFHGLLGGILWLFTHWVWTRKAIAQHTIVSAITGYLYWLLYSEYNFPNSVMSVVAGYFGVDFVKQLVEFFGKKLEQEENK